MEKYITKSTAPNVKIRLSINVKKLMNLMYFQLMKIIFNKNVSFHGRLTQVTNLNILYIRSYKDVFFLT